MNDTSGDPGLSVEDASALRDEAHNAMREVLDRYGDYEEFDPLRRVLGLPLYDSPESWEARGAAEAAGHAEAMELAELRRERERLREALEADAQDPCDAAAFYGEDGYDKCLDPEYNDMSGNPTLTRCYSCRARAALRPPENPEATTEDKR